MLKHDTRSCSQILENLLKAGLTICKDMDITKVFPICEIYDSATHTITEQKASNRHVWMQFVTSYMVLGFLGPVEKSVIQQSIGP